MNVIKNLLGHLRHSPFSQNPNAFIFRKSSIAATRTKADMVQAIASRRTDLEPHMVQAVLDLRDECQSDFLLSGLAYQDDNFHHTLNVKGEFIGATARFDPEKQSIIATVTPTAKFSKAMEEVTVTIEGESHDSSYIDYVVNESTGTIEDKMVPGATLRINGKGIKIAPLDDPAAGVFFTNNTGAITKIATHLIENTPSTILFVVPSLADGQYTLSIATKSISGTNRLLKDIRTFAFERKITVGDSSGYE